MDNKVEWVCRFTLEQQFLTIHYKGSGICKKGEILWQGRTVSFRESLASKLAMGIMG